MAASDLTSIAEIYKRLYADRDQQKQLEKLMQQSQDWRKEWGLETGVRRYMPDACSNCKDFHWWCDGCRKRQPGKPKYTARQLDDLDKVLCTDCAEQAGPDVWPVELIHA